MAHRIKSLTAKPEALGSVTETPMVEQETLTGVLAFINAPWHKCALPTLFKINIIGKKQIDIN